MDQYNTLAEGHSAVAWYWLKNKLSINQTISLKENNLGADIMFATIYLIWNYLGENV